MPIAPLAIELLVKNSVERVQKSLLTQGDPYYIVDTGQQ